MFGFKIYLISQFKREENSALVNSHRFNVEDDVVLLSVTFELDLHLIRDKEDNREVLDDDF